MKRAVAGLLVGLLLWLAAGCTAPTGETEPTPTPRMVPNPVSSVVKTMGGDSRTVALEVQGAVQTVTMTEVTGSFADAGGPEFRLYADLSRYRVNDVEGRCYVTLSTGMSGDVYAELCFRPGESAAALMDGILGEYGRMTAAESMGRQTMNGKTYRHLQGKTVQNLFDVFLLDVEGGCVTVVISSAEQNPHHRTRLLATVETLEIS